MRLWVESEPLVTWAPTGAGPAGSPGAVVVDALHDGALFPWSAPLAARSDVRAAHAARRAVGTADFARALAEALGQPGFLRVEVARVALDLDLPPGIDPHGVARAVGAPVAGGLIGAAGVAGVYRAALRELAEARAGARLSVSVVALPLESGPLGVFSYTDTSAPPVWVDPIVPRALLERTADPLLVDGLLGLTGASEPGRLEPTALAVRATVFDWMKHLQGALGPSAEPLDPAGRRMWSALLDVSALSAETWAVRAHLHHGLEAPPAVREAYAEMRRRYAELSAWVRDREPELLKGYLERPERRDHLVLALRPGLEEEERAALAEAVAAVIAAGRGARGAR